MSAVTTPSGISPGAINSRATRSARTRKAAPPMTEAGSSLRCSGPSRAGEKRADDEEQELVALDRDAERRRLLLPE